jgi:hypothetical protein
MTARWSLIVGCLASLSITESLHAQFDYPVEIEKRGDVEARLMVAAAKQTAVPGIGAVTLTLTIEGPATLEVEEPHLSDALDAWKEKRSPIRRVGKKERVTWSQVISLSQVKAGLVPVADVSVRFRSGPGQSWEEAKWIDILKQIRDVPSPPVPPVEATTWSQRWVLILVVGLVCLLAGGWWLWMRRRDRPAPPLPADQWALRELDRIERTLLPPHGEAEVYYTQLSQVIRRYLTERFGLHALEQTTVEFLEEVRLLPQLNAEQQATLREFFERCDLAKFARAGPPPEECRQTAELARTLVGQTKQLRGVGEKIASVSR